MISITDESKVTKTFPMENLNNKKVLSDCNRYLGDGICFNNAKEEDSHSSKYSSNFAKEHVPTNAFTFSMALSSLGSPLPVDKPLLGGNSNFVTPDNSEGKTNSDSINQATSSMDFSVLTPADFGITSESFAEQGGSKSILKKLRRRSTVGVRGSPENNSLIRYIAYRKRMKTVDSPSQTTPFKRNVLLKDKISAFRSSFKPLEEAAEQKIQTPYTCFQSQNTNEELSSTTASQQSCKKVRFAEKQSLEIFDETKMPITPLQKGYFPSTDNDNSCLRSVLKKTPVRMLDKDTKKHLDYTNTREGSEEQSAFQSCGPLQTDSESQPQTTVSECYHERSIRPVDKMEAHNREVDVKVIDAFQPVSTPIHNGETSFSPSGTRNDSCFNTSPIKTSFSQPNFDGDDDLLQETSEVISKTESVENSGDMEDKETKVSSSDLHVTCIRLTRSSAKKVNKVEEANVRRETRPKRTCTTSKVQSPRKIQNKNSVTKSASKKAHASRRKTFGKRKRKKKSQKIFNGHYETVSKKPLLSPIPEMTEDVSLTSFYQSTPESSVSILDHSCSRLVHETPEEPNRVLDGTEEGGNCLHSNLSAMKEDALPGTVSSSFLQLQDAVPVDTPLTFPLESPGSNSSKDLKNAVNGQVLKSNYSNESGMELGLLNLQGTGEKNSSEASHLIADSAVEQPSGGNICVNVKKVKRRSRRITLCLPSVEDFQPETPRNNPCVPIGSKEELPCTPQTVNNSGFFNDVLCSIEDSFRSITSSTQKRVRRSMRKLKNVESEGLVWISVPTNDCVNQAPVGSDYKARRKSCAVSFPESEMLHQKQENFVQTLSPMMMKDQKSACAGMVYCRPRKKRKSICSQCEGEH